MNIKQLEEYDEAEERLKEQSDNEWAKFMEDFDKILSDQMSQTFDTDDATGDELELIDLEDLIEAIADLDKAIEDFDNTVTYDGIYEAAGMVLIAEEHPLHGVVYKMAKGQKQEFNSETKLLLAILKAADEIDDNKDKYKSMNDVNKTIPKKENINTFSDVGYTYVGNFDSCTIVSDWVFGNHNNE